MAHCVSNMIGIRTGGVFSDNVDSDDMKNRIAKIINGFDYCELKEEQLQYCISSELSGNKGSYVVIAGVFNYWLHHEASEFAQKLSAEFCTEVMLMSWDEESEFVQCNIFLDGKQLFDVSENPIGRILRRIS